jgi:hypothetical protein
MSLVELPRRRSAPRVFVEPAPDLGRRVSRALDALGDLPDELELPGRGALAEALIALADALDGDPDIEGDDDEAEDDADEARIPRDARIFPASARPRR